MSVSVQNVGGTASSLHVNDLDGGTSNHGGTWTATVVIGVEDDQWNAVPGAMVVVNWAGVSSTGTVYCTTVLQGRCAVSVPLSKRESLVTFTVDSINHSLPYVAADNHDVDADSDGTTITLFKP